MSISRDEYLRLKRLDERFGDFLDYLDYLHDIHSARVEKKAHKGVSQERLFKRMGLA